MVRQKGIDDQNRRAPWVAINREKVRYCPGVARSILLNCKDCHATIKIDTEIMHAKFRVAVKNFQSLLKELCLSAFRLSKIFPFYFSVPSQGSSPTKHAWCRYRGVMSQQHPNQSGTNQVSTWKLPLEKRLKVI